ncbi:histone deacetylase family protein [Candidatus Sumerlaeota bacterium]|nr:histone deacetylase family protein [Candidatus Sumerlaeota bacterium]
MIKIRLVQDTSSLLSRDRIEQVQGIFREAFPGMVHHAERISALIRNPMQSGHCTALLLAEGALSRVDAFALVLHFPEIECCFLDFIAARAGARGSGVGGALYEAVREFCQGLAARGLYMEVVPDLEELTPDPGEREEATKRIRFYEQFGVRVIDNSAYSKPIGDPPTTALLLFDGLGRTSELGREEARAAVHRFLTTRFAPVADVHYIREVMDAFREDSVPFRPPLRSRTRETRPVASHRLARPHASVYSPKHELHHVKERGYFERPVRVETIRQIIDATALFTPVKPRPHGEKWVLAVHHESFVHYLETACTKLGKTRPVYPDTFPIRRPERRPRELPVQAGYYCIDTGTPLYPSAYTTARAAVDTALTAADEILAGRRLAYAVCRPPGHHAGKLFHGGFCYFNNAAIAAHFLSSEAKVAILDIDYHHGNGTQDIFYERNDVLTVSIHGHPDYSYPYFSGYRDETGQGRGLGFNCNLPLPPRTEEQRYLQALDRAIGVITAFNADILVVSLGFDILKGDPTGTFLLNPPVFQAIRRRLNEINRPLLVVQEGGYNIRNIRRAATAFFEQSDGNRVSD